MVVKEALANGRLTERNGDPAFAAKLGVLRAEAQRLRTTIDALTLAAALARPWADVVLSGAAARLAGLVEAPEEFWAERGRLPWT